MLLVQGLKMPENSLSKWTRKAGGHQMLRKAAARTIPDLWQAITEAIPQSKPHECANYLDHAGYAPV